MLTLVFPDGTLGPAGTRMGATAVLGGRRARFVPKSQVVRNPVECVPA